MTKWTCPSCGRVFGAVGRGHICAPGLTLQEFYDGALPITQGVVETIIADLRRVDPDDDLVVDPLASAILLKNGPTFATVRSRTRWVAVGFSLERKLTTDRLGRKVGSYGKRFDHVVNVADPDEVDDELLGWLREAFLRGAPDPTIDDGTDPMVPDDIDLEFDFD